MRSYNCPCGQAVNEAQRDWDILVRTRRCPKCARPRDGFVVPPDEGERVADLVGRRNLLVVALIARLAFIPLFFFCGALGVPEDIVVPLAAILNLTTVAFAVAATVRLVKPLRISTLYAVGVIFGLIGIFCMAHVLTKANQSLRQQGYVRRFA